MSKMQDSSDDDDDGKERKKGAAAPNVIDLIDSDDDDLEKMRKQAHAVLQPQGTPMEITRNVPGSSSSARHIPKKPPTAQAMPKTESKTKTQAPTTSQKRPESKSSSSSKKRPLEATRAVFAGNDDTEQPKQKKQRTGGNDDPVRDFGLRLQAVMYRASELDSKRLLGPYIIRWLFFIAMEMLPADGGVHWMDFLFGCISSFLAPRVIDNAKKWDTKAFHGDEMADFMDHFADTIVKIANDTNRQTAMQKKSSKQQTEEAGFSPEYLNSSDSSRKLAVVVVAFLQRNVQLDAKTNKAMIIKPGDVGNFEKLRDQIRLHLYQHTRTAVNQSGPPSSHAWFIWDFLEECTDEQVPPSQTNGVALSRGERARTIHDGSMINSLLEACFEIVKSKHCGMLKGLYAVELCLHRVSTTDTGASKWLAEAKAPISALKGLTALAVLLAIANSENMLPTRSQLPNAELYKSKLDGEGVFEELFRISPSLQTDVIQYISTCRAQLKQRYRSETPPSKAPPAERKTKFSDWALVKLSSSSSQGQGADKLIGAARQFLLTDLTRGLLTSLERPTSLKRNATLAQANLLLDEFLPRRIGTGVVRPIVIADAVSETKEQKRELARSVFARAFGDGIEPNESIAKDTGDFRLWADLAAFRITDTSIHLNYAGFVWSLASRGGGAFDVADKFVSDDNTEAPLIDKPRADTAKQQSNLSQEHVLHTAARGGSGRFLTWWIYNKKRICTFGVLKTHSDRSDSKKFPLTMLVPKDMGLLLKLHLTDVLEVPLLESQTSEGVPLKSDQMDKLQYMYSHAKGGFEDDRKDDKYCVDFRVMETLSSIVDTSLQMHKSKERLSIFSSLPSVTFLQGGVVPVEAWRSNYLAEADAKSMTGDAKRDELLRNTNDMLLDELLRVNGSIQKAGKRNEVDMSSEADELSDIPADLKLAYAGLFDLLAACRVRGYMAEAEAQYFTAAGSNIARNSGKRELLKLYWDNPNPRILNTSEQIQLVRAARAAQMAFLGRLRMDEKTTSGHPSMKVRLDRAHEAVMEQTQLLDARIEEITTEEEREKEEMERSDDFEATEAVQDAEMHMNAFLQVQSNLVPIIKRLDKMMENPDMEELKTVYQEVIDATSGVYEVLLTLEKDQFTQNFQLYEQYKNCELLMTNEAAVKGDPMLQYWINKAKSLDIKKKTFVEVAAVLLLIDRFKAYLIALGNDFIDQAEEKLRGSKYVYDGGAESEGGNEADDDEEDDSEDADRQFEEDKALKTEADRINALGDRTLISVCAATLHSCGLRLADLAPDLQQHTRDLLIEEQKLSTVANSSVELNADMFERPAPLLQRDMDQQMTLTEDGKTQLRQTKYRNQEAIRLVQRLIVANEKKTSEEDDSTAMVDDDDDDKKKMTKKRKQEEVLIKSDADRTTLRARVTRLRVVLYILEIADPETKLNIPTAVIEPILQDITVHEDLEQIRYLLNEDSKAFNKRANKLLEIEFAARKAIDKTDGKKVLEFIVGAEEALQTIKSVITKRFNKRNVNEARKQLQMLSQLDRGRLISVYLREGRPHPQLPLRPLMEEICSIVHHARRPKIWTMLQTAADLLKLTPPAFLDRWMNMEWSSKMVSGFASDAEKYTIINRLVVSECLPYRILRAQLLFGLVPSVTDTDYYFTASSEEDDDREGVLHAFPFSSTESYQLHLLDLEAQIASAKVITNPDNYKNGAMGIDAAIRVFISKNTDIAEEPADEKKTKKKKTDIGSFKEPSSLTDFAKHQETERFLAYLCSKLYDRALDVKQQSDESTEMNTTSDEASRGLTTIEAGYPWRRGNSVMSRVLATFESEFKRAAQQRPLNEKTIQAEVDKHAIEDTEGKMSLVVNKELIVNRLKRDQIMNALFNKAFEWRLPAPPPGAAAPTTPSENAMLTELAKEQLEYMYSNIKEHLLKPMLSDMADSRLSKDHKVVPEVERLLRSALVEASKPETLLIPIKLAIDAANARMDIHLDRLWQETRKASADGKLPPKTDEKLFGVDSNPQAVLDVFQAGSFSMQHLLSLLEHRQAFYRLIHAGIKYLQLLPLLLRVVRLTFPANDGTFEWTRPPENLGLEPVLKFSATEEGEAERLRQRIYVKFQEVSEILVNHSVYLPTHLDLQAVLEAYWGLDMLGANPRRLLAIEETKEDSLVLFNVLYPSDVNLEHLQTVRRMLGWQNPRDALEYYVYKRQAPAGQNIDVSKYRDPIAPVHWEEGTLRLEELNVPVDAKEDKKQAATTYAYWNSEAVALRYTAKLARLHFGLAFDAATLARNVEAVQAANDVFRTLAIAMQMLKNEKTPIQHILTRLAIPKLIESKFADSIKQANSSARMQHLYRGVFSFIDGGKDEIITVGGTGRLANRAGKVKADERLEAYLADGDSFKLGLRAEDDKYYEDSVNAVDNEEDKMQDDGDLDKKVASKIIGSLTFAEAATAVYFKENKTTGIAQLGNFAHWATVDAWQNKDRTLRDDVMRALGGKIQIRAPRKKAKAKKTAKDQQPLALPLPGESKETKAVAEPPVVVTALPRSGKRKLLTNEQVETLKRQQAEGIRSSMSVDSSSSRDSMAPSEHARMAVDIIKKDSMDTSGRLNDDSSTRTPPPRTRTRKLFYSDSNPVVVTGASELTTHPASLVPSSRAKRKLLFGDGAGKELQRVPVSVS